MAGKFMKRGAVVDTIKSEERTNALQKRNGTNFAVRTTICGCPDPNCGAWHTILEERPLPTPEEAAATLKKHKAAQHTNKRSDTESSAPATAKGAQQNQLSLKPRSS